VEREQGAGEEREQVVVGDAIVDRSAGEIAEAVRRGDIAAIEVAEAFLSRIEFRAAGRAFITTCPERAFRRASRRPAGPLAGVPLAVKDLIDVSGVRTTSGSSILVDRVPARTAAAVRALEAAGAIVVGKTNMDEFAWGTTSQNPHWGTVANPVRPGRVAGGSSGGNAAALADGQATIALGTDTGGSVRIPAACCDVVGFKTPHALVPTRGVFPLAPSCDTVGPMARTVRDCALVYAVLSGQDVPRPRLSGIRVGVLAPTGVEEELAGLGALVDRVTLPVPSTDLMPVFLYEAARTHRMWFPELRDRYGPALQVKLDAAGRVPRSAYADAIVSLRALRERARIEPAADVVVSPTLSIEPPSVGCWEPDVRDALTHFTRPFNFLGWPAISIGNLQIAGRDDRTVLGVALALEESRGTAQPA
jgi:aspartyl-tRNA(Asn)/glutamyl-tRNA(Gln) amidotransferase subunit A